MRKLAMLDAAETLDDLRVPPVSRLEALRGEQVGQYSIRINQQWRICCTSERLSEGTLVMRRVEVLLDWSTPAGCGSRVQTDIVGRLGWRDRVPDM